MIHLAHGKSQERERKDQSFSSCFSVSLNPDCFAEWLPAEQNRAHLTLGFTEELRTKLNKCGFGNRIELLRLNRIFTKKNNRSMHVARYTPIANETILLEKLTPK